MRENRKSGSVGALGGQLPRATRQIAPSAKRASAKAHAFSRGFLPLTARTEESRSGVDSGSSLREARPSADYEGALDILSGRYPGGLGAGRTEASLADRRLIAARP